MANLANLPGSAGQTAAPGGQAVAPPNPAGSAVAHQNEQDEKAVADAAYQSAYAALEGMPPGAREGAAREAAAAALEYYRSRIAQGVPPANAFAQAQQQATERARQTAQQNGLQTAAPPAATRGGATVNPRPGAVDDVEAAKARLRRGVTEGGQPYSDVLNRERPVIQGGVVDAYTAAKPERIAAELQARTDVQGTKINTDQSQQARDLQLQNIQQLQQAANGQGAVQQGAAARMKLALQRQTEAASGLAAQARGAERRGLRRQGIQQASQRGLDAALGIEAQAADQALAAQGQVSQAIQGTRTTDVDVEKSQAGFDARRNELQAQLDAARRSNNQDAINDFTKRLAELDVEVGKFNAEQKQKAGQRTAELGQEAATQTVTLDQGQDRLRLEAEDAARKAAEGLLSRDEREQQLALAREQLRLAEEQLKFARDEAGRNQANVNRQFWAGVISSLITGAATIGAAYAKHGGITSRLTIAGEAGPELVIPIHGRLSKKLARELDVDNKPFGAGVPASKIAALLAAANLRDRKAKGV